MVVSRPMSDLEPYLDVIPSWLSSLGQDAGELGTLVTELPSDDARRCVVGGLNYIFKSLDLIPDGIDDLGLCDDAFVIRVAAALACDAEPSLREGEGILQRLANDAKQVESFLEDDYARLVTYVQALKKGAARGRLVEDIIGDDSTRASFLHDVSEWSSSYKAPSFTRDVKTLIKLRAFLKAKLA
jgi:uncharacterized membrane protein YkvA (DUF1232 family)